MSVSGPFGGEARFRDRVCAGREKVARARGLPIPPIPRFSYGKRDFSRTCSVQRSAASGSRDQGGQTHLASQRQASLRSSPPPS